MLIDISLMSRYVNSANVRGIFHIGANTCQELSLYMNNFNISKDNIIWIEAIPRIVEEMKGKGITTIYQAVLDETPGEITLNVTSNNGESASILELNTHKIYYPTIKVVEKLELKSETLSNFIETRNINKEFLDFLVMDIQGAELRVLRGSPDVLTHVKMICTEINAEELYHGAGLFKDLKEFLELHDFTCVSHVINNQKWGDALFIKNKYI
jgi:FkbM family methyltransferase